MTRRRITILGLISSEQSVRRSWQGAGLVLIIAFLVAELALSVRRESQTWDEACHIFAGYASWKQADFGVNPEHPPLVKLVATLPILGLPLTVPISQERNFKVGAFLDGHDFLYANDADRILFRARMASAIFAVLLAIAVFGAGYEMFGAGTAFLALVILVLEPSILAHGALVTTDIGLACCLFASVYAFYRYTKKPSPLRLLIAGLAAGLALSAKHSGVLLFPILILLAFGELALGNGLSRVAPPGRAKSALRWTASAAMVGVIAVGVLWASYGFRFAARPEGQPMRPSLTDYAQGLKHPIETRMVLNLARWHVLPESYLYGLVDVQLVEGFSASYLFGKVYPSGRWFYFPAAFVIKSSLVLLLLLAVSWCFIARAGRKHAREILFLAIPPGFYFIIAVWSGLNLGVRHILPIYPFLIILAGWAAWRLIARDRRWVYAVALLLLFDAVSSLGSFPNYIAYANELWGGPANTYRLLTDSNVDWGQQLPSIKKYLDRRGIRECWFAYFADVVAEPAYYGIPCKPLTTIASVWLKPRLEVPAIVNGPVLISAAVLSGYEFGPRELNPYEQFQRHQPVAVIDHSIFVFDGHFEIALAAALNHVTRASLYQQQHNLHDALAEAQMAVTLAPNSVWTQEKVGSILREMNRPQEAREAFQKALSLAQTIQPERQKGWVPGLQEALK